MDAKKKAIETLMENLGKAGASLRKARLTGRIPKAIATAGLAPTAGKTVEDVAAEDLSEVYAHLNN